MFARTYHPIKQARFLPRYYRSSKLPALTHPLKPLQSPSSANAFSTTTIHKVPVSDKFKMEAKQSNQNFKLENLFSVKGKGNLPSTPIIYAISNNSKLPSSLVAAPESA
jgi:hypothetical protein